MSLITEPVTTPSGIADVLDRAADEIESRDFIHCSADYHSGACMDPTGLSATGALSFAGSQWDACLYQSDLDILREVMNALIVEFGGEVPPSAPDIVIDAWSDAPDRTGGEVIATMRSAARKQRELGGAS